MPDEDNDGPTLEFNEIEGFVWCVIHECVHADSTDPYGGSAPKCVTSAHRRLYVEVFDVG